MVPVGFLFDWTFGEVKFSVILIEAALLVSEVDLFWQFNWNTEFGLCVKVKCVVLCP